MLDSNLYYFTKRSKCPICNSTEVKRIYQLPYESKTMKTYLDEFYNPQGGVNHEYLEGVVYALNACNICDLVYQENVPNEELMYKLYEEWIDPKIVFKIQEKYPLWYYENYSSQLFNVISFFNKPPNQLKVLDFGMGWGKWCLMAKAYGCQAYGLELSSSRINYAKKNAIEVLNMETLGLNEYDFINVDQVLEHLPDPIVTLKELLKCLAPKGIIKISVPNGDTVHDRMKIMNWSAPKGSVESLNVIAPLEHINCFKTKTILNMSLKCGLIPLEIPNSRKFYRSLRDLVKKSVLKFNNKKKSSITMFFQMK